MALERDGAVSLPVETNARPLGFTDPCAAGHDLEPRPHGEEWNDEKHEGLSVEEIRRRFPRRRCRRLTCGAICYDSYRHYIAGDW